jgi:hypothetical protein
MADYNAWAKVVIQIWKQRMIQQRVGFYDRKYTPSHTLLMQSFVHHVNTQSNGDVQFIEFMFNLYGRFVDIGVGKDTPIGNSGDLGANFKRKRKPWYSKAWFLEVRKLQEYLGNTEMPNITLRLIEDDLALTLSAKMGDLKYASYGKKDRNRNMANYQKQIGLFAEGKATWKKVKGN